MFAHIAFDHSGLRKLNMICDQTPGLIFHDTELGDDDVVRKYYDQDSVKSLFKQMGDVPYLMTVGLRLKSHIGRPFEYTLPSLSLTQLSALHNGEEGNTRA